MFVSQNITNENVCRVSSLSNKEFEIVKKYDTGIYYVFQPAYIHDYKNTNNVDNVEIKSELWVRINEWLFNDYLLKYMHGEFDFDMRENRNRKYVYSYKRHYQPMFEYSGAYNFFNFEQIKRVFRRVENDLWNCNDEIREFFSEFIHCMNEIIKLSTISGFHLLAMHGCEINPYVNESYLKFENNRNFSEREQNEYGKDLWKIQ